MNEKEMLIKQQEESIKAYKENSLAIMDWIKRNIEDDDFINASMKINSMNEQITKAIISQNFIRGLKYNK